MLINVIKTSGTNVNAGMIIAGYPKTYMASNQAIPKFNMKQTLQVTVPLIASLTNQFSTGTNFNIRMMKSTNVPRKKTNQFDCDHFRDKKVGLKPLESDIKSHTLHSKAQQLCQKPESAGYAAAFIFLLRRKASPARPAAKSGSPAGSGTVVKEDAE
jgi:hypothetical protein